MWLYLQARKQTSPGYIYGTLILSFHTCCIYSFKKSNANKTNPNLYP